MTNSYKIAERINSKVNASVTYKTDLAQYDKPVLGVYLPLLATVKTTLYSNVNYYLSKGGQAINLACVCYMPDGGGHCVLWADTDKGSFILDNNYDWPVSPVELPYTWESMLCGGKWLKLLAWQ